MTLVYDEDLLKYVLATEVAHFRATSFAWKWTGKVS